MKKKGIHSHFLGNWRRKNAKTEQTEMRTAEVCDEAEETRVGWYAEAAATDKENPKKINLLRRKGADAVPELSPLQSGCTDIVDILAPTSVDLCHRDYIVVDGVFSPIFI